MVDEGMSLARALEKGGFESLFALDEIQQASREAPAETREEPAQIVPYWQKSLSLLLLHRGAIPLCWSHQKHRRW